jgi:hypothetical protein
MKSYRPGQTLRLTDDGRLVTIWSAAPGPGCYWCHVGEGQGPRPVQLVRITQPRNADRPKVALVEEGDV